MFRVFATPDPQKVIYHISVSCKAPILGRLKLVSLRRTLKGRGSISDEIVFNCFDSVFNMFV